MSLVFKGAVAAVAVLMVCGAAWWLNAPLQRRGDGSPHVLTLPSMDEPTPVAVHRANELWVCADPNNLPFSNAEGQGFEDQIAALIARALGRELRRAWVPAAFARKALEEGDCDLIVGVPTGMGAATTRPYYRSSYVFVTRPREAALVSFADPRLDRLTVGIQLSGDEAEAPPARAMVAYHRAAQIRGYVTNSLVADGAPARRIVDAVATREIAAAAVWGPLAGYYAADQSVPLIVTPIARQRDTDPQFAFDIAMATRGDDASFVDVLNQVLEEERRRVQAILRAYRVPLLPQHKPAVSVPVRATP